MIEMFSITGESLYLSPLSCCSDWNYVFSCLNSEIVSFGKWLGKDYKNLFDFIHLLFIAVSAFIVWFSLRTAVKVANHHQYQRRLNARHDFQKMLLDLNKTLISDPYLATVNYTGELPPILRNELSDKQLQELKVKSVEFNYYRLNMFESVVSYFQDNENKEDFEKVSYEAWQGYMQNLLESSSQTLDILMLDSTRQVYSRRLLRELNEIATTIHNNRIIFSRVLNNCLGSRQTSNQANEPRTIFNHNITVDKYRNRKKQISNSPITDAEWSEFVSRLFEIKNNFEPRSAARVVQEIKLILNHIELSSELHRTFESSFIGCVDAIRFIKPLEKSTFFRIDLKTDQVFFFLPWIQLITAFMKKHHESRYSEVHDPQGRLFTEFVKQIFKQDGIA